MKGRTAGWGCQHKKAPARAGASPYAGHLMRGRFNRAYRPAGDAGLGYFVLAIFISRSTVRQEYPHSLSYQETTLKNRFSPFRLFCRVARLS